MVPIPWFLSFLYYLVWACYFKFLCFDDIFFSLILNDFFLYLFTFICCCSVTKSCQTLCNPMDWIMPGFPVFTISWSLLKFMSNEWVMLSNHLILCCPLLLLRSIFPGIRVFSNEYSGLISFRIDWFDILVVRGTLKSFLQHQNSQASILQYAAFFMVHLSHLLETTMAAHSSTLAWKIPWTEEPGVSISLIMSDVEHLCMCLVTFLMSSLDKFVHVFWSLFSWLLFIWYYNKARWSTCVLCR